MWIKLWITIYFTQKHLCDKLFSIRNIRMRNKEGINNEDG